MNKVAAAIRSLAGCCKQRAKSEGLSSFWFRNHTWNQVRRATYQIPRQTRQQAAFFDKISSDIVPRGESNASRPLQRHPGASLEISHVPLCRGRALRRQMCRVTAATRGGSAASSEGGRMSARVSGRLLLHLWESEASRQPEHVGGQLCTPDSSVHLPSGWTHPCDTTDVQLPLRVWLKVSVYTARCYVPWRGVCMAPGAMPSDRKFWLWVRVHQGRGSLKRMYERKKKEDVVKDVCLQLARCKCAQWSLIGNSLSLYNRCSWLSGVWIWQMHKASLIFLFFLS